MLLLGILIIWLLLGLWTYGLTFAYYQGRWPQFAAENRNADRLFALFTALLAPISFPVVALNLGFQYGWRLF